MFYEKMQFVSYGSFNFLHLFILFQGAVTVLFSSAYLNNYIRSAKENQELVEVKKVPKSSAEANLYDYLFTPEIF